MSYRKLKIGDKQYEYVIGKTFVKVKGLGLFAPKDIGQQVVYFDVFGKMCFFDKPEFVITPQCIKNAILGLPVPEYTFENGEKTSFLHIDPFSAEIHNRIVYYPANYENYCRSADEI